MQLFILSKSNPLSLSDALSLMEMGDSLLLIDEATNLIKLRDTRKLLATLKGRLYLLEDSLKERGLGCFLESEPQLFSKDVTIDYQGFVQLALSHAKVINWN
jgi:sulfur relay protein TusB/DsrH